MAWYDGLIPGRRKQLEEKLNPAQPFIAREEGFNITIDTDDIVDYSSYNKGFEILEKYGITF